MQKTTPVAKKKPHILKNHGDERIDNYFWMHEKDNPETLAYLESENSYVEAAMQHTEVLQSELYQEMLSLSEQEDFSVPYRIDQFYYYWRQETGESYKIFCRKQESLDAPEEVLLDCNKLAQDHDYFRLGGCEVSPDHNTLAYAVDTNGDERYVLSFLNLKNYEHYHESLIVNDKPVWANDSKTCFYVQLDEAERPRKLFRHTLGDTASKDTLIHHETDDLCDFLEISKTRSQAYFLLYIGTIQFAEYRYLDANNPTGIFQILFPRSTNAEAFVEHHKDSFYIMTNDEAANFKLVKTSVVSPDRIHWQSIVSHSSSIFLEKFLVFSDYIAVLEKEMGSQKLRIHKISAKEDYYINLPDEIYDIDFLENFEFNTEVLRFLYMSPVTPDSVFECNMRTKELILKKETKILGYDKSLYHCHKIMATAPDGVQVPISLVYKKGVKRDGKNPLFIYGYGCYGAGGNLPFYSDHLPLLNRGVVIGAAHVRGGGDLGAAWHECGKLLHKKNTFTDFIACAEHLIEQRWTSCDRLILRGDSAGGLLVGAAINLRPDLFLAAVSHRPCVDILSALFDSSMNAHKSHLDEWGNPNKAEYYHYIKSYNPYDNIVPQRYPHLLITTGFNDPRVSYWEAVKWVAKLRELKTDDNLLLLKIEMESGHLSDSGLYSSLKELSFEYAFILDLWGLH
jgi:oligopeptidase B